MDVKTSVLGDTIFRPESFFLGRTEGAGLFRDPLGRVVRRCQIVTVGSRQASYGALELSETFTFDDGQIDPWKWVITAGGGDRYMAAEQVAGSGISAHHVSDDFVLNFHRPSGRARGFMAYRYATRLALMSPTTALKTVKISQLGAPIGVLTAIHRCVAD